MMAALNSMPNDLITAYTEVFDRIGTNANGQQFAIRVMSWIFYAARPLRMCELMEALVVEPGDTILHVEYFHNPGFIVEECKGLIFYDKKTDLLGFSHYTLRDYFASVKLASLLRPLDLTKTLLTYLSFDVFKSGACRFRGEVLNRLKTHKLSLYAAKFWHFHLKKDGEYDREVQEVLFSLFGSSSHVESLLELYSLNHELIAAINAQTQDRRLVLKLSYDEFSTETTLLHFAARYGLLGICEKLLLHSDVESGPAPSKWRKLSPNSIQEPRRIVKDHYSDTIGCVNLDNGQGHVALHLAAWEGHKYIVKLLLNANANPNVRTRSCDMRRAYTPLHLATRLGHLEVVQYLLEKSAHVMAVTLPDKETSLHIAARCGYLNIAKELLAAGAGIDTQNIRGSTPAHCAILWENKLEVLRLLTERGADLSIRGWRGFTALHLAIYRNNVYATKVLLNANADPMARDFLGNTSLHVAAKIKLDVLDEPSETESLRAIVRALLQFGADVRAESKSRETAFLAAILAGNIIVVEELLEAAAHGLQFRKKDLSLMESIESRPAEVTVR